MSDLVGRAEVDALVRSTADHPHIVFTGWGTKLIIQSLLDY